MGFQTVYRLFKLVDILEHFAITCKRGKSMRFINDKITAIMATKLRDKSGILTDSICIV